MRSQTASKGVSEAPKLRPRRLCTCARLSSWWVKLPQSGWMISIISGYGGSLVRGTTFSVTSKAPRRCAASACPWLSARTGPGTPDRISAPLPSGGLLPRSDRPIPAATPGCTGLASGWSVRKMCSMNSTWLSKGNSLLRPMWGRMAILPAKSLPHGREGCFGSTEVEARQIGVSSPGCRTGGRCCRRSEPAGRQTHPKSR